MLNNMLKIYNLIFFTLVSTINFQHIYATVDTPIDNNMKLGDSIIYGNNLIDDNNNTVNINYILSYSGLNYPNKTNNFAFSHYTYIGHNHSLSDCIHSCNFNNNCKGLFVELDDYPDFLDNQNIGDNQEIHDSDNSSGEDSSYNYTSHNNSSNNYTNYLNESLRCYMLSNLGYPLETDNPSFSYTKTHHYIDINANNISNNNHEIIGYIDNWSEFPIEGDTHVYLDLNHNGVMDINEPNKSLNYGFFEFTNLTAGNYLVKIGFKQWLLSFISKHKWKFI